MASDLTTASQSERASTLKTSVLIRDTWLGGLHKLINLGLLRCNPIVVLHTNKLGKYFTKEKLYLLLQTNRVSASL